MDTVIRQLSEIETAALAVMEKANANMKICAKEMDEKTVAFDQQSDLQIEEQIKVLRSVKENELKKKLAKQQADGDHILQMMVQNYEEHHKQYVRTLFQTLVKE